MEKDGKMGEYHKSSELESRKAFSSGSEAVYLPVKLKSPVEILDAFGFFGPVGVVFGCSKLFKSRS